MSESLIRRICEDEDYDLEFSPRALLFDDIIATISAQQERIEELELIAEGKLKEAAEGRLVRAGTKADGSFQFDIRATIVPVLAEHMAQTLKALGGENSVSFEVDHDEIGALQLIIARRDGELPASKALRFEKEVSSLRSLLSEAGEVIKPFATDFETLRGDPDESDPLGEFASWALNATVGDLRRAKEFLDKLKPAEREDGDV